MNWKADTRELIRTKLKGSAFYWRHVRRRRLEDLWWAFRSPQVAEAYKQNQRDECAFYRALFGKWCVRKVFDIGANCGDKTEIFLGLQENLWVKKRSDSSPGVRIYDLI